MLNIEVKVKDMQETLFQTSSHNMCGEGTCYEV